MVSARAVPIVHAQSAINSYSSSDDVISHRMLDNFCWKCSLRTGTFCCGVISLVLSTLGIITNGAIHIEYQRYLSLEKSLMFEEVLTFVVSAFCIHGALKEFKYSLLPWLVVTAISITVLFFTALYYILFGCFDLVMIGLLFLILACFFVYGWIGVASYYSELRDREICDETPPTRSYIDPTAVISPPAFTTPPPPPYTIAIGTENPAFEEKPPTYEEAESSKQNEQRQQQVV